MAFPPQGRAPLDSSIWLVIMVPGPLARVSEAVISPVSGGKEIYGNLPKFSRLLPLSNEPAGYHSTKTNK